MSSAIQSEISESVLYNVLTAMESWMTTLTGAGGSGKTSAAWKMAEEWFPELPIALFRYSEDAIAALPDHIRKRVHNFQTWDDLVSWIVEKDIQEVLLLLDETALHFLSRSTSNKENKDATSNFTIGRHNGLKILSTAQNTILVDKGLFESLEQFSLRCWMSGLQTETEREEAKEIQRMVNTLVDEESGGNYLQRKGLRYCPETDELFRFPKVEWMTPEISRAYRGWIIDGGTLRKCTALGGHL